MGCAASVPASGDRGGIANVWSQAHRHPRETRILQVEEVDTCKTISKTSSTENLSQDDINYKFSQWVEGEWQRGLSAGESRNNVEMFARNLQFLLTSQRVEGEWRRGLSAGGSRNDVEMFARNPQFLLTVRAGSSASPQPTPTCPGTPCDITVDEDSLYVKRFRIPVFISLLQTDTRKPLHIAFFVYKAESKHERLEPEYFLCVPPEVQSGVYVNSLVVQRRCWLWPGLYVVVAAAFHPNHSGNFKLTNFRNGEDPSQYRAFDNYRNRVAQTEAERIQNSQRPPPSANRYENVNSGRTSESNQRGKLIQFLQIDDVDSGRYDDPANLPRNSCTRPCRRGDSRTCYYRFVFEPYSVLGKACNDCLTNINDCYARGCVTADGFEKAVLTINRRMPGPSIQVCEGDLIVVDVKNMMPGRSTAVHWHGIRQRNSKFMDGVPMVTQCPIDEAQIFRYTFRAEDPGLHFYHSHDGLQKVDGIVGSLVVRQPRADDPNRGEYDFDLPSHVIVVQDWYHMVADGMFPGLRYRDTEQMAASYLIQGRGQYIMADGTRLANTPIAEFNVTRGSRYVFRIIAGTCFECQYVFTVENHDMVIIGGDAHPTRPYRVDSLTMSPGERFSVVINANQPVGAYWMQVRTVGLCRHMRANQVAVLRYQGGPSRPSSPAPNHEEGQVNRVGLTVNPINSNCTRRTRQRDGPCVTHLRSPRNAPPRLLQPQPDMRIVWAFGFYFFTDEELFSGRNYDRFLQSPFDPVGSTVNGIVNMYPPSPILSQPRDIPRNIVCPPQGFRANTWNTVHRECVHVMKVPVNSVIEIVAIDIANYDIAGISHAIHLHGYDMYMMEQGIMPQGVPFNQSYIQLMRNLDSRRSSYPPDVATKDTYPLTAGGYAITRIFTDNPGYWFFHCHFAYHLDSGMSGILQVGEANTFPRPPDRFPTCGDYLPDP